MPPRRVSIVERCDNAVRLMRDGAPISEACRAWNIARSTLWAHRAKEITEILDARRDRHREADPDSQRAAIAVLREQGWSLSRIGAALGVSRQRVEQLS